MIFPPTPEEMQEAQQLGIDPQGKSGPELRGLIKQAQEQEAKKRSRSWISSEQVRLMLEDRGITPGSIISYGGSIAEVGKFVPGKGDMRPSIILYFRGKQGYRYNAYYVAKRAEVISDPE